MQTVHLTGITPGLGDAGQTVTIGVTSSTTSLIPNAFGVNYTNPNSTGTITFTPIAGAVGTATITVTITDNGPTGGSNVNFVQKTFTVNLTANNAPTLAAIGDVTLSENNATTPITLSNISDGETGSNECSRRP